MTNTLLEGHSHFSWKALAANVAGSVAGYYAGQKALGDGQTSMQQFARDVSSSFAGGYAENTARQWMGIGGKRSFETIAIDAFGNALGNSVAGAHRAAADKAIKAQRKSFAGVGPIIDWRNKAVKYDMDGYTPIFDWRTKPMKSDFSGYEPLMGDYLSTASYNNTPMPDIGMCYVPKVDNSAYYAAMSKGMELKPAMTPEQRARAEARSKPADYGAKSPVLDVLGNTLTISGISSGTVEVVPNFSLYSQSGSLKPGSAYLARIATTSTSSTAYTGKLGAYAPGAKNVLASYNNAKVVPVASSIGKALGVGSVVLDGGLGLYEVTNEYKETGSVRASTVTYNGLKIVGSAAVAVGAFVFSAPVALGIGVGWAAANYFGGDAARAELQNWLD